MDMNCMRSIHAFDNIGGRLKLKIVEEEILMKYQIGGLERMKKSEAWSI